MRTINDDVADWLDGLDYAGIYPASILPELDQFGVKTEFTADGHVRVRYGDRTLETSVRPAGVMRKEGIGDPKGPMVNDDIPNDLLMFGGFEISRTLCILLLGSDPADRVNGRGFAHRMRVDALRKAPVPA